LMTAGVGTARLDIALVLRGLAPTRSRARDLIQRGLVTVDGAPVVKPAALVRETAGIEVSGSESDLVSRGAVKLRAALETFGFSPAGRIALDVGASTGGFTQTLLARGATKVYAVDVGHGQLHPSLTSDPRVISHEGTDARSLTSALISEPVTAIVADVSFISLEKALPQALSLASPGAWLVTLVKPQFEVGRAHIGKGGIVRDEAAQRAAVERIAHWLAEGGRWRVRAPIPSPIAGGSGNTEFLLGATIDV
jgi:23S rRNA (cytidine1920-2'-O)/16S rRNA (cytidine1409-2'-O)-methyltransferase